MPSFQCASDLPLSELTHHHLKHYQRITQFEIDSFNCVRSCSDSQWGRLCWKWQHTGTYTVYYSRFSHNGAWRQRKLPFSAVSIGLILYLLFQFLSCSLTLCPTSTLCFSQTPEELEDDSDFEQEDYDTRSRTSVQTEDDQLIAGQSARVSQCSLPHCAATSHIWQGFGTWHKKKLYFRKHLFGLGKVWATSPNSVYTVTVVLLLQ